MSERKGGTGTGTASSDVREPALRKNRGGGGGKALVTGSLVTLDSEAGKGREVHVRNGNGG